MDWVNANLPPINSAQVTNDDIFENGAVASGGNLKEGIDWTTQIEQSFWQEHANTFIIGDSNNGIYVHIETGNYCLRLFHNGQEMVQDISLNWDWGPSSPYYGIFYAGYNDSTQKGSIGYLRRYYNFPDGEFPFDNVTGGSIKNNDTIYLILKDLDEPVSGGGAGSGYIGNSLLSNKKMVGYNVPTSSATGTKTESVNDVSASAVSGKPKSGNGFARIKLLREVAQFRSIDLPLANRIVPAKFKPEYAYYYGEQEVPKGEQYYDIEGATAITIQRGGGDSFTFGDLPACFGIYDPNSSNVVNWYLRKVNSSGATMLVDGSNMGSFSPDGNYTFYVIAGGEPFNPNGKGYFTIIRTTDWSNGWGGLAFSTEVMEQLRSYFT